MKRLLMVLASCGSAVALAEMPMPTSQWSFEDETNLGIDSKGPNNLTAKFAASTTYDTPKINTSGYLHESVKRNRFIFSNGVLSFKMGGRGSAIIVR